MTTFQFIKSRLIKDKAFLSVCFCIFPICLKKYHMTKACVKNRATSFCKGHCFNFQTRHLNKQTYLQGQPTLKIFVLIFHMTTTWLLYNNHLLMGWIVLLETVRLASVISLCCLLPLQAHIFTHLFISPAVSTQRHTVTHTEP